MINLTKYIAKEVANARKFQRLFLETGLTIHRDCRVGCMGRAKKAKRMMQAG